MTPYTIPLSNEALRLKAIEAVKRAPEGYRVTFEEPRRSSDQNRRMWAMLNEIAAQVDWHGCKMSAEDWKDWFMHALKHAKWVPDEHGGMVPVGMRTSKLSTQDMTDLMMVIEEFGARHAVEFKEAA